MTISSAGRSVVIPLACALWGCSEPYAPLADTTTVYSLAAIDGVEVPVDGVVAATLALSSDRLFIHAQRDTAGATSIVIGTHYAIGPFEFVRVNLEFVPDDGPKWHAVHHLDGDSLTLERLDRIESYRAR